MDGHSSGRNEAQLHHQVAPPLTSAGPGGYRVGPVRYGCRLKTDDVTTTDDVAAAAACDPQPRHLQAQQQQQHTWQGSEEWGKVNNHGPATNTATLLEETVSQSNHNKEWQTNIAADNVAWVDLVDQPINNKDSLGNDLESDCDRVAVGEARTLVTGDGTPNSVDPCGQVTNRQVRAGVTSGGPSAATGLTTHVAPPDGDPVTSGSPAPGLQLLAASPRPLKLRRCFNSKPRPWPVHWPTDCNMQQLSNSEHAHYYNNLIPNDTTICSNTGNMEASNCTETNEDNLTVSKIVANLNDDLPLVSKGVDGEEIPLVTPQIGLSVAQGDSNASRKRDKPKPTKKIKHNVRIAALTGEEGSELRAQYLKITQRKSGNIRKAASSESINRLEKASGSPRQKSLPPDDGRTLKKQLSPSLQEISSLGCNTRPRPKNLQFLGGGLNTFRSETLILVSRGEGGGGRASSLSPSTSRAPICSRRGVGALTVDTTPTEGHVGQHGLPGRMPAAMHHSHDTITGSWEDIPRLARLGDSSSSLGVVPAKYTEVGGGGVTTMMAGPGRAAAASPSSAGLGPWVVGTTAAPATMFSYSGPPRPAIPEEPAPASTTLDSAQCSAPQPQRKPKDICSVNGSGDQCFVGSFASSTGELRTGGSGHGDRVAPLAALTEALSHSPPSATDQENNDDDRTGDNIAATQLQSQWFPRQKYNPLNTTFSEDNHNYINDHQGLKGYSQGILGTTTVSEATTTSVSAALSSATQQELQKPQSELVRSPLHSTQQRLGDHLGTLGGGKKEGGRGPSARPPRSRQDHLEKLRKCTERLKSPSPDQKTRSDTSSATSGGTSASSSDQMSSRNKGKRGSVGRNAFKKSDIPPHLPKSKSSSTSGDQITSKTKECAPASSIKLVTDSKALLSGSPEPWKIEMVKNKQKSQSSEIPGISMQSTSNISQVILSENKSQQSSSDDASSKIVEGTSLPPRPPQHEQPRLLIQPRIIPFRSASVSQVDVNTDGSFFSRDCRSPTAIRLHPVCKDYWGANTLPRRKPGSLPNQEAQTPRQPVHPPLTQAVSFSNMVDATKKIQDKLQHDSKWKSESELSKTGIEGTQDGSKKLRGTDSFGLHSENEPTTSFNSGDYNEVESTKCTEESKKDTLAARTESTVRSVSEPPILSNMRKPISLTTLLSFEELKPENFKDNIDFSSTNLEKSNNKRNAKNISMGIYNSTELRDYPGVKKSLPGDSDDLNLMTCYEEKGAFNSLNIGNDLNEISENKKENINRLISVSDIKNTSVGDILRNENSEFNLNNPPGGEHETSEGQVPLDVSHLYKKANADMFPDFQSLSNSNNQVITKTFDSDKDIMMSPSNTQNQRNLECQVLMKESRLSQCLVIKSSTAEGGEVDLRSRPRLPHKDSEGDSIERPPKAKYMTQLSDEGIYVEDPKPLDENKDTSDSSSQDSVSLVQDHCGKTLDTGTDFVQEPILFSSVRRNRKTTDEGEERSVEFPHPRKGSRAESLGYSSVDSNGLRSLATSVAYGDRGSSCCQRSSCLFTESLVGDISHFHDNQGNVIMSDSSTRSMNQSLLDHPIVERPVLERISDRTMDRAERKKKHFSDPSCERRGSSDTLLYLSDPSLSNDESVRTGKIGLVSQNSTDSEGREDSFGHIRFSTPRVRLSGHESDSSYAEYFQHTPGRTASPGPYLGDSDSGDRSAPRSPHGPRRYSKRPLRGPYGEMLEIEMSKTKERSPYLAEDTYQRLNDRKSCSPRPPSPHSPALTGSEARPMILKPSRSLDDSALRINYGAVPDRSLLQRKVVPEDETADACSSPIMTSEAWDLECEGTLSPLPFGPIHQRTSSSPSKLFSEPVSLVSEEEQEYSTTDYYDAATKLLAHQKAMQLELKQQQQQQQSAVQQPAPTDQVDDQGLVEDHHKHRFIQEHRQSHKRHRDMRAHVIGELYETEKNYVENLYFLLNRYQQALKSPEYSAIIDSSLVDDIFEQVPEIHNHHNTFLEEMKRCLDARDASMCVGDIILHLVRDPDMVETYTTFTNNWKTAQEATKVAVQAKPAFRHFLLAMTREHPRKIDLKGLLIKPIQRFPQYELLLKRLLKHTSREHTDYSLLSEAILVVQQVAGKINAVEQEVLQHEQQQLLLKELENVIEGLVGLVQPDRTFHRHDLVTQHTGYGTRKERCLFLFSDLLVITAIKRRSGTIRKGSSLPFTLLSSLESNKFKLFKFIPLDDLEIARSRDESVKKLENEVETLQEDLSILNHIQKLTKSLRGPSIPLEESVHELLSSTERQLDERHGAESKLLETELTISTAEGMDSIIFVFNSSDKRSLWEEAFNNAKQKLAMSADRRPPPEFVSALPIRKTRAGLQFTCATATLGLNTHNLKDVWVCNSDGYVGQVCVLSLQPDPTVACCNGVCNARILSIASIPAAPHLESSDDEEDDELSHDCDLRKRRSESLPPDMNSEDLENQQPTMWLGTEDGFIHVYNCSDTIRIKKNKFKFQPGSPVHCIIYLDNRVFASLANGDIIVYKRDISGCWDMAQGQVVGISTAVAPVTRMIALSGKLWCAAMNTIRILNTTTLQVEHSFVVGGESGRGVSCIVSAGHGIWVAVNNSAAVRLFHATTYECLCEVNVAPAVTKMLAGCDDIIRQHKAACLRVTSLLACKDLLWVGTSAGVIITVPLPHLAHNTHRVQAPPNMVGIPHGHTGHVRFLTCVEMTPETRPTRLKSHSRYSLKGKDHSHQMAGTAAPTKLLVISGGDGYEDFRNSGASELAGRDDSTNHLLLWQV